MSFVLTETAELVIAGSASHDRPPAPRWQAPPHLGRTRPCLILVAGERWQIPLGDTCQDIELFISFGHGLAEIPADGCTLELKILTGDASVRLLSVPVANDEKPELREARLSLGHLRRGLNRIEVSVSVGPCDDPSSISIAISELVIGRSEQISLLRSRAFHELRFRNELAHFASVYDHKLFDERRRQAKQNKALRPAGNGERPPLAPRPDISAIAPEAGEGVYPFAHRLLAAGLRIKSPDFFQRLSNMAAANTSTNGALGIMSCCAGAGQVEASLIRSTDQPVALTLIDVNQHLLDQAAAAMPENCDVTTLVQDVNAIDLTPESFDLAIFVSGVHHIVELERLWSEVHRALRPGGELWLIGEQIGPNGNRLDADCLAEANRIFGALPARLRRNAHTGAVDTEISNNDCAEATFEGIRSEDIEPTLARHFLPVDIYKRNCFLWRLVNQAYFDNYDLTRADDVDTVRSMVVAEIDYFLAGGKCVELHGVYRAIG